MDTLLILLGVLGFGAVIIAIHVFSVDSESYGYRLSQQSEDGDYSEREQGERRSGLVVDFPLMVNGTLVREDRRSLPERRRASA